MTYDASELRGLSRDLGAGPRVFGQMARVAVRKTLKDIERDAKRIAPRDPARPPQDPSQPVTGNLRNAIRASDLRGVTTSGSIEGEVVAGANYSPYQEYGTSTTPPRPFMGPALDKNAPAFEQAMDIIAERAAGG